MKNLFTFALLLCLNSLFSQVSIDSIRSSKLHGYRSFSISLPKNYEKNTERSYPIIILFDGDYLFHPFKATIDYGNYWRDLPEAIIVGIHQNKKNERVKDCAVSDITGLPVETGAAFFDFINLELFPQLDKQYRISHFKILAGNGITAGYMNLFLYRENPVFNGFIAISPDLDENMINTLPDRLTKIKTPFFYYLSTADGDKPNHIEKIMALNSNLDKLDKQNLFYKFDNFKNDTHYSLVLKSIPSALYDIFSEYPAINKAEYEGKIVVLKSGYVEYLRKKYDIIQKSFGIKMPIRMNDFNAIEAAIVKNQAYNEYEELATLANTYYPKAMLGEYYVAKYYEQKGNIKMAAKSYLTAFNLEPIGSLTKDMMIAKSDDLRKLLNKDKKHQHPAGVIEETPVETPVDAVPTENTPTETTPDQLKK